MAWIARVALANPRRTIAVWAAAIGLLALAGFGVESQLHRSDIVVPGTTTARTNDVVRAHYGEQWDITLLLVGPPAAVDRQGQRLAAALAREPHAQVLTPWMLSDTGALRPAPDRAVVIARFSSSFEVASRDSAPAVRRAVARMIRPPVRGYVSGYPDIANGISDGSLRAISSAELIAGPLLLLVLLLVFRSPIAALLPLMVGFMSIGASKGVLSLANRVHPLDALSLNLASMMGLALGVDYALLLVSRYREETAVGASPARAAEIAVRTAGRTIVCAGAALTLAMLTGLIVAPGSLLTSASFGLLVPVGLSVVTAVTALPAVLVRLGPRVDKWRFGRTPTGQGRFARVALRALRHPALAAALVILLVLAIASPALALHTGPPDPRELPAHSRERNDYTALRHYLGSGWLAPYEINVFARHGRITDPRRLSALYAFETELMRRRDVSAVLGIAAIAKRTRPLSGASRQLADADASLRDGIRSEGQLVDGLSQAASGVDQLRAGLAGAIGGADQLSTGGASAHDGAARVSAGVASARAGAERLQAGLAQARAATGQVQRGSARALDGVKRIDAGLASTRAGVGSSAPQLAALQAGLARAGDDLERLRQPAQLAQTNLQDGLAALGRMKPTSQSDPEYRAAYTDVATALGALSGRNPATGAQVQPGYGGMDAALAQAAAGVRAAAGGVQAVLSRASALERDLGQLLDGTRQLERGVAGLDSGIGRLGAGFGQLTAAGSALSGGLAGLDAGSAAVAAGVDRLRGSAGTLSAGLSGGDSRIGALRSGLGSLEQGAITFRARTTALGRSVGDARRLAPLTRSGYFTLAALDSASPAERTATSFVVNLDRGGDGARIMVIGYGNAQQAGHPLRRVLESAIAPLERASDSDVLLGGTATGLQDFDAVTSTRFPLLVLLLLAVTYVALVALLRSLLLPLLAVALNLLTVVAAFGVLALLFEGSKPILGGPGFIDAISAFGVYSIMFGLSIDYEVFLLARMREGYALTRTSEGAIAYGLRGTAGVVTGAAVIMAGIFFAFATTGLTTTRQLGVGLTAAVVLDATVIRLVLLPAAIRLCGERIWHQPRFLRRRSRPQPLDEIELSVGDELVAKR